MEKTWSYLSNQFLNSTRDNYKKALILSNYHEAAITAAASGGDPDFELLRDRYQPVHAAYTAAYTAWKNAGGVQEGQTLNLDQLLELLITKVDRWDVAVQVLYAKTTPAYKTIFPNVRKPFYKGSIDQRINAVATLAVNMAPFAGLAATAAEVGAFYTSLDTARDAQEAGKSNVSTGSTQVESTRIAAMTMQYANLGFLMNKFYEMPNLVAAYFDLSTLRESRQTIFTGTLDPGENEAILIHTFMADDEIRLHLTGPQPATFYLASMPNGTDSDGIQVNANEDKTITVSDFGVTDYHANRYLTAINSSAETVHYHVELY